MSLSALIDHAPINIKPLLTTRYYEKGRHILFPGESNTSLFLLTEGIAEVSMQSHQGKNISLRLHTAPDTFGVLELFDDQLKTQSVIAKTDCQVIVVQRKFVLQWMEEDFQFNLYIIKLLSSCFRQANALASILSTMTIKERVLLSIYQHHKSGTLTSLTKEMLINEVCTPRRSLNRIIQDCYEEGILEYNSKTFHIINLKSLEDSIGSLNFNM
ncbi:Crp/Fnr family transcriptional regulator [Vallitalea sp.]|jgi:CRP-like cAMP-binding protein|uniref:Crp/Fnr family transcriptional regulator n=1 Tax=Vallitalea sp. TaxID=1882829 RepID=UPI0025FE7AB6|nr:Crp/Fnr family transcriptional regulator [Vallitalea sp.]MCT4686142.1 Crp/Fnr family transcriptional regulator [Vallitalea sp.]